MLYKVIKDDNNYILSIGQTVNGDVELDLSGIDFDYLNAYQLISGTLILDEDKKNAIIGKKERKAKDDEIAELQKKLTESDYVVSRTFEEIMSLESSVTFITDFIRIIKQFKTEYAEVLANRKTWRARIEELK